MLLNRKNILSSIGLPPKLFSYALVALLVTGCTGFSHDAQQREAQRIEEQRPIKTEREEPEVMKFSKMIAKSEILSENTLIASSEDLLGWHLWTLAPHKNKTHYHLQKYQGKTVIHADAIASASGLIVPLKPKRVSDLNLAWSWKALANIATADNAQGSIDDAPLRLVLAFEGDKSQLPLKDQLAFEMAKLISGHDLPYATLMYIWSEKSPVDTLITNKHLGRVKAIVVDSGTNQLNVWREHRRSIEQDYQNAFGERPGKLIAIGIMTDTDNTKSSVKAIYGDIELTRTPKN